MLTRRLKLVGGFVQPVVRQIRKPAYTNVAAGLAIVVPSPAGGDDRTQKQQVNMFYIILLAIPILSYRILTPLGRYDVELWYVDHQTSTDFFVGMPPGLRFIANCFHELFRAEFFIGTCFDSNPFEILPFSTLVTMVFFCLHLVQLIE